MIDNHESAGFVSLEECSAPQRILDLYMTYGVGSNIRIQYTTFAFGNIY